MDLNKVFTDFDEADPSATGGRNPKLPGYRGSGDARVEVTNELVVEVQEVHFTESKRFSAVYFVVEFRVISSTLPEVKDGGLYSWTHDMTNKWFGAANTKQFIAACCGHEATSEEAKAITQDEVLESWSDEQPLAGIQLNLKTAPKTTKGGFDIVVHDWSPLTGDDK